MNDSTGRRLSSFEAHGPSKHWPGMAKWMADHRRELAKQIMRDATKPAQRRVFAGRGRQRIGERKP